MSNELFGTISDNAELNVELKESNTPIQVTIVSEGPKGERGITGGKGDTGLSSYELWLQQGNVGTIDEFLNGKSSLTADLIAETEDRKFMTLLDQLKLSGYVHTQMVASAIWTVDHPLDKFPSVSIVDTGGNLVSGDVEYISRSRLIVTYCAEFSGEAYLN